MKVVLLNNDDFKGKVYNFNYISDGYYDLIYDDFNFSFQYKSFGEEKYLGFKDTLLGEWLENPILYGAYDEKQNLMGFIEVSKESWNNRLRVSNLLVFEKSRKNGVGTALINQAKAYAKSIGTRVVVLETQTCNIPAINFYRKNEFKIIGFDYLSYSNQDIEKHEVRIEMGFII